MFTLLAFVVLLQATPGDWARAAQRAEDAGRYADAASWYSRISADAPGSYVSRKAETRLAELRAFDDYDYVPYARYQNILRSYANLGSEGALAEARAILETYPEAAVAPHVWAWIANEHIDGRGDLEAAFQAYRSLYERFPKHELAPRALDLMGRIRERQKRFGEAIAIYAELQNKFPEAKAPREFERRLELVARGTWRTRAVSLSRWLLVLAAMAFFAVGGWRVHRGRFFELARGKVGFALVLGIPPAAFLWVYDGQWSPSLTLMAVSFSLYGIGLAALGARMQVPPQRAVALGERLIFGILGPLAVLILILARYDLWEAFGL